MRPGDGGDLASAQHVLRQPLRARRVRQPAVEQPLDDRLAAAHHVADDDDVGLEVELFRSIALDQRDALRLELRAHRRVDAGIRAGDAVARRAGQRGDAAHERAADAEDVQVHQAPAPKTLREIAIVATVQVTAIAKPVTSPVSSAERRMWPTISRYQITNSV